jgi:hypothetical protein
MLGIALYEHEVNNLCICIITDAESIKTFCEMISIPCIYIHKLRSDQNVISLIRNRNEIKKLIATKTIKNLHFSHTQFSLTLFLIISILHESTLANIHFHNFEVKYPKMKFALNKVNLYTIRMVWYKFKVNLICGLNLEIRTTGRKSYCLAIPEGKIHEKSKVILYEQNDLYSKHFQLYKSHNLFNVNCEKIFLGISSDIFSNQKQHEYRRLINFFRENGFFIKNHPKFKNDNFFPSDKILDSIIPVEYFFKYAKIIIGYNSASLITACMFEDIKVISLIKILKNPLEQFDLDTIEKLKIESDFRILFPEDFSTLELHLNN